MRPVRLLSGLTGMFENETESGGAGSCRPSSGYQCLRIRSSIPEMMKNFLWQVSFTLAFPLPFFAHHDKDLKDFLHRNRIDFCFNRPPERLVNDRFCPLAVMYRETLVKFQPCDLPRELLPAGYLPDYLPVDLIDFPANILNPHAQLLNNPDV